MRVGKTVGLVLILAGMAGCNAPSSSKQGSGQVAQRGETAVAPGSDVGSEMRTGAPQRRGPRARAGGAPGQFDFYLLNLSWSPEFCATHAQSPECSLHLGFIVHGLWPQNNDGTFPENCSTAPGPTNPASWHDIMPDVHLVQHEWQTHGTCTGLAADAYFGLARKAFHEVAVPAQVSGLTSEATLPPAQIVTEFAQANPTFPQASIALSCGNNRLTAIEVCIDKGLQPISCNGVKSCRANVVKVTAPGGAVGAGR